MAATEARRKLIGAVHAAAKQRGLEDGDRRDLMERVTGKRSLKDMNLRQISAVLDELNGQRTDRRRNSTPDALEMKARALWHSLALLGAIRSPTLRSLDEFANRQAGVSALRFATPAQKNKVIEALKDWCGREGFEVPATGGDGGREAKIALLEALWVKLSQAGAIRIAQRGALSHWASRKFLGRIDTLERLTNRQLDDAAVELGRWLKKASER